MHALGVKLNKLKDERALHLFILPALICYAVVAYFPMYGMIIAFKNYNIFKGILGSPWASNFGFEHFIEFFNSPNFGTLLRNTLVIAFLKLGLLSIAPVILAMFFNEISSMKFKRIGQTISYLPHFISWVVVGGLMYSLLNPKNGPLNLFFVQVGLINSPIDFISAENTFWPVVVLSQLWKDIGYSSILYLAVITSIDVQLYEAIDMDGGGRWAKAIHVTWPALKGTFVILFILSCGQIMSGADSTFDQCYVLGNEANRNVSDIFDTYILRAGLENARFSYASAIGIFKSVINLLLLLSSNKISKLLTEKSLF